MPFITDNDTENSAHPFIAVDGNDTVHLVWAEYSGTTCNVAYASNDGTGWTAASDISASTVNSTAPVIAVDSADNVHVVWVESSAGGILLLSTPNICCLRNRFRLVFNRYPFGPEWKQIDGHVKIYNTSVLKAQLRGHGFELLSIRGVNFLPFRMLRLLPLFRWISSLLSKLLPSLCTDMVVAARKTHNE